MEDMNRRRLLERAGQTTIGVGALGTLSGTAAADPFDGHYVNTRDYYNCEPDTWWQPRWWDHDYNLPSATDDLTIFVHGFDNDHNEAYHKGQTVSDYLEPEGYNGRILVWSWKSDCGGWTDYDVAETIAGWEGRRLADFIDWANDYYDPVSLRVVCHSLGSRVLLRALHKLTHEQGHSLSADVQAVTSAHILGGAEHHHYTHYFDDEIQSNSTFTYNYMNEEDDALAWLEAYYGTEPLGTYYGLAPPCNYLDRNHDAWDDHGLDSYLDEYAPWVVDDMADSAFHRAYFC